MVEVFSRRYIACNQMFVAGFRSPDTIFVLAYAVVLLNTDLHSRAVKASRYLLSLFGLMVQPLFYAYTNLERIAGG